MKLKDLMVGDWVHSKLHNVDTVIIDVEGKVLKDQPELEYTESVSVWLSSKACWERHYLGEIEPIPLTEKILTDSGFKLLDFNSYCENYELDVKDGNKLLLTIVGGLSMPQIFRIVYTPKKSRMFIDISFPNLYVHELQHALRLCDIEKEIVIK